MLASTYHSSLPDVGLQDSSVCSITEMN